MGGVKRVTGERHGRDGATTQRVRQDSVDLQVELDICWRFSRRQFLFEGSGGRSCSQLCPPHKGASLAIPT